MGALILMRKRIKYTEESEISNKLLQCVYPTTFGDFKILASDSSKFKLITKESLLIVCNKLVLNRMKKSFLLDLFAEIFTMLNDPVS